MKLSNNSVETLMQKASLHNSTNKFLSILWRILVIQNVLVAPARSSQFFRVKEFLESEEYDKTMRPGFGGPTTEVNVGMYVISFGNIKEVDMEFPVYMYLRQYWVDPRFISHINVTTALNREYAEMVWRPDTYCTNARETNLMMPDTETHTSVIIEPDGRVFYSRGSKIVGTCHMDLKSFPFDQQICHLKIWKLSDSLHYHWVDVEVEDGHLAQFDVTEVKKTEEITKYTSGNFSHFQVDFTFTRRTGYYISQVYLPCIFIVFISWIVFWMDVSETSSRLTVGITAILTIMFLESFVNASMPKVSYMKAIDIYLMVAFAFLFLNLFECILVYKFHKDENAARPFARRKTGTDVKERKVSRQRTESQAIELENPNTYVLTNPQIFDQCNGHTQQRKPDPLENFNHIDPPTWFGERRYKMIDKSSGILFPVVFLIMNVAYWVYYTS